MGTKRKRRFSTWEDAENAEREATARCGALKIALRELVLGKVKWLEDQWKSRRIGLCQLGENHGGVVILIDRFIIDATWLDWWTKKVLEGISPPTRKEYMPEYNAWLDVRQIATQAKELQRLAQEKSVDANLGCTRLPLDPEVDQNVRIY